MKAKLPNMSPEIAALKSKLDKTVKWLESCQQATTDEYEERRKEIEVSAPLMKVFYDVHQMVPKYSFIKRSTYIAIIDAMKLVLNGLFPLLQLC